MKTFLLFSLLLLFICPNALATNDWTQDDTYRQLLATTLLCVDWLQTKEIVNDSKFEEKANFIIKNHPTNRTVNLYFLATLPVSYIVARNLSAKYRRIFQWGIIAIESVCIISNYNQGIKIGGTF